MALFRELGTDFQTCETVRGAASMWVLSPSVYEVANIPLRGLIRAHRSKGSSEAFCARRRRNSSRNDSAVNYRNKLLSLSYLPTIRTCEGLPEFENRFQLSYL
jgi:hypothetical protein